METCATGVAPLQPFAQSRKKFFRDDVADASGRAAAAGVLAEILPVVSVVKGQLLSRGDVTPGRDPDLPLNEFGVAIRSATVIKIASRVPAHGPVNVPLFIQLEDQSVAGFAAAVGFRFRDFFADIFNQQRAGTNRGNGESAQPVNGRWFEFQNLFDSFSHGSPEKPSAPPEHLWSSMVPLTLTLSRWEREQQSNSWRKIK